MGQDHAADALVVDAGNQESPVRRLKAAGSFDRRLAQGIIILQVRRLETTLGKSEMAAFLTVIDVEDRVDLERN